MALLGAGGHHIQAPGIHGHVGGAEAGDAVGNGERCAVGFDVAADASRSLITPVEVSEWVRITARIALAVSASKAARNFRIQGLSPFRFDHLHLKAVGLGHLHPALTKLAVVAAQHLVAAAEGVDDPGFHRCGAAAGDHQHVAAG